MYFKVFNPKNSDFDSNLDLNYDDNKNSIWINSENKESFLEKFKNEKKKSDSNYDLLINNKLNNNKTKVNNNINELSKKFNKIENTLLKKKKLNNFIDNNYKNICLYKDFKTKDFEDLNFILSKLFCYSKFFNEIHHIKKYNILIINSIIKKKFGEKIDEFYKDEVNIKVNNKLIKDLENIFSLNTKRNEEQTKLILKLAYKTMFKKYLKINNIKEKLKKYKKNYHLKKFYESYFKNLCNDSKNDIYQFYLPNNKYVKNKVFKSINNKYLKLISKNKKFIDDLKESILYTFENIKVKMKIKEQIYNLLKSWEDKLLNNKITYEHLINDIKINKKLKWPWTLTEIFFAQNLVIEKLNKN